MQCSGISGKLTTRWVCHYAWWTLTSIAVVRLIRPAKWLKNLLVFAPVLFGHEMLQSGVVIEATLCFVIFSIAASGQYALNDVFDCLEDRRHDQKRRRPVAAGEVSSQSASMLGVSLVVASLFGAQLLRGDVFLAVAGYHLLAISYSVWLKNFRLVDLVVLVALHLARIFAGGAATGITISYWLTALAALMLLHLAALRRYSQLREVQNSSNVSLRGYRSSHGFMLKVIGFSAVVAALVVFALYIVDPGVTAIYTAPARLWPACAIIGLWAGRDWVRASRGEFYDDPLVEGMTDRVSYLLAAVVVGLAVWAA